ncbi:MAG: DUF4386 domain-containing protein [Bacteroidota bacterium]
MDHPQPELVRTARLAGLSYLALAVSGMVGFLTLHPQLFISGDISQTLTNLREQETLARLRLVLEFAIVVSQAVAAAYFFKLFKNINLFAAWALAAWGLVNAVAIMVSAMAMAGAINVATSDLPAEDQLLLVRVFDQFIRHAWGVGSLFFGLWLIPMGFVVVDSQRMPVWLGRILMLGGVGYITSAFVSYLGFNDAWVGFLPIAATIGEFWMIAYLLMYGIRPGKG